MDNASSNGTAMNVLQWLLADEGITVPSKKIFTGFGEHILCIKAHLSDTSTAVSHISSTLLLGMLLLCSRN